LPEPVGNQMVNSTLPSMNPTRSHAPSLRAAALPALFVAAASFAQTAPAPSNSAQPASGRGPDVSASPGVPPPSATADQAVLLNPLEVSEDSDKSYGALNSNSITRFNTELNKMPISADIFDQTFMNDVGVGQMGIEGMIQNYSA